MRSYVQLVIFIHSIPPSCVDVMQVQFVSGASPLAYWLSAYLWDVLLFIVLTVLVMLAFLAYGRDSSRVSATHTSESYSRLNTAGTGVLVNSLSGRHVVEPSTVG